MADLLRLVTIDDVGRARLVLDLNTVGGILRSRDTFQIQQGQRTDRTVTGPRRYDGSTTVGVLLGDGTIGATFAVTDASMDAPTVAATIERLLANTERVSSRDPLFIEWRPDGLQRSVYARLRGPATVQPNYLARVWAGSRFVSVVASWPCAPLLEGLPMDLAEDFRPPADDASGRANLITNPSFEDGTVGAAPTGWAAYQNGGTGTVVKSATASRSGAYCALLTATSAIASLGAVLPNPGVAITPGKALTVAAYSRAVTTPRQFGMIIGWYDALGALLTTVAGPLVFNAVGSWTQAAFTATPPANAAYATVYVSHNGLANGEQHLVEDVVAHQAGTDPAYFDGDSPLGRWLGVPHQSAAALLAESKLADYTIDTNAAIVQQSSDPTLRGLVSANGNAELRVRHTGRGYKLRDGAVTIGVQLPTLSASTVVVQAGKIVGGAAGEYWSARLDVNATGQALYVMQGVGGGASAVVTSVDPGAAVRVSGGRLWIRLVIQGGAARAELSTVSPRSGGGQPTATPWVTVPVGLMGPGEAVWIYQPNDAATAAAAAARVIELQEEPFTFSAIDTPDELVLRGVPGNAPATAEVRIVNRRGISADFALLAWRSRNRGLLPSTVWNGDVSVNTNGWATATIAAGLNAGGSIAMQAAGGPVNSGPYLQITGATNVASGATFRFYDRIHRGSTYTIEFWAKVTSGSWEAFAYGDGGASGSAGVNPAGAAWKRYRYTWTPIADVTRVELLFRTVAAAAGVIGVGQVRMWEGADADAPTAGGQLEGRGAFAPFGLLLAESDDVAGRVAFAAYAEANLGPTARALRCSATAGSARWYVDPELLPAPLGELGVVDVEVYALARLDIAIRAPRFTLSSVPELAGARSYTREFGQTGKAVIADQVNAGGVRAFRLGTLPFEVDGVSRGRHLVTLDYTATTGGNLDLLGLVFAPARRRMASPTGKVKDAYYPTAMSMLTGKTFAADGRGFALGNTSIRGAALGGTAARDTGIGGEPLELEPGDNELLVMATNGVPDDPSIATGVDESLTSPFITIDNLHVRVTPRYRLMRDT